MRHIRGPSRRGVFEAGVDGGTSGFNTTKSSLTAPLTDLRQALRWLFREPARLASSARSRWRRISRLERAVFLGSLIYGLIFSVATVGRYYTFHTFAWDLGVYSQGLFTTAHANGFFLSTPDQPNNPGGSLFGVHFAPVLFLLVPLYWLVPSPATLLVVQSFALGSGAPILFRLVRSRLPSDRVAAVFAFGYLLNPALQGVNCFDFTPGLAAERHSTWQPLGASSIYQLPAQLVLNPLGVLNGLASESPFKLLYLFLIFGPVLFLPFRRPLTVLMPAPWMVLALTG